MGHAYEEKVIAFVDILGFRELVRQSEAGVEGAPNPDAIVALARHLGSAQDRERIRADGPLVCPGSPYRRRDLAFEITQVSDCVVVSAEVSPSGVIHVLNHCFGAAIMIFRAGFLCRGYVTRGKIVHTDQHFFGTGYVRAYEHERKVSVFQKGEDDGGTPFIEIDPAVCRYVAEEGDECVRTMFGRMVETDEHGTAISPFPALKKIPATVVRRDFDPLQWKEKVEMSRRHLLRDLSVLERAEQNASPRGRAKIEHFKAKIREVLAVKELGIERLDAWATRGELPPIQWR